MSLDGILSSQASQVLKARNEGMGMPYLTKLTPELLAVMKDKFAVNVYDWAWKDTIRLVAGSVLPTTPIELFTVPKGTETSTANNAALKYSKTIRDTNMSKAREFDKTDEFWMYGIECQIENTGSSVNTLPSGIPVGQTPLKPRDPVLNVVSLAREGVLTVQINGNDYEQDNLDQFYPRGGVNGFAGSTDINNSTGSYARLGNGKDIPLTIGHIIPGGVSFGGVIQFSNPLLIEQNVEITVRYRGIRLRSVA
jgi:hypothetical protein